MYYHHCTEHSGMETLLTLFLIVNIKAWSIEFVPFLKVVLLHEYLTKCKKQGQFKIYT